MVNLLRRFRGEMLAAVGTLSTPAVALLSGFLTVKYLLPAESGMLSLASLVPTYLASSHAGVLTGMSRDLPLSRGAGDAVGVRRILATTSTVSLLSGILSAFVCVAMAILMAFRGEPFLQVAALIGSAFVALSAQLVLQIDTGLRGLNQFSKQGSAVLWTNLLSLVSVGLIPTLGATGAVARTIIVSCVSLVVRIGSGVRVSEWAVDWPEAKRLARIGLPLLISGTLAGLLMVADRTVVAILGTKEELGEFSLAWIVVSSMQFLPQSISLVMFPKVAHAYGRHRTPAKLRRYVWLSLLFNTVTLIPASLLAWAALDPLVMSFAPNYVQGLPAAKIACLASAGWIYVGVGTVIGVLNRMTPYLVVLGLSVVGIWVLSAILMRLGYGIVGSSWARVVGTWIICVFTIVYSLRLTSGEVGVRRNDR